jgi:hypothetical protein
MRSLLAVNDALKLLCVVRRTLETPGLMRETGTFASFAIA